MTFRNPWFLSAMPQVTGKRSASFAEVPGRRLTRTPVLLDVVLNLLAISQGGHSRTLDSGNMDENILPAIVRLDKSKTLCAVEPFHGASRHARIPSQ
jgi:hypothetical protein